MLGRYMQLLVEVVSASDKCSGLGVVVKVVKNGLFPILQIGVPILLIVFGTLDLGKAVISSDEKAVKEAQSKLIKRCIYAVAVFFIVTIVNILFSVIGNVAGDSIEGMDTWRECWNEAMIIPTNIGK